MQARPLLPTTRCRARGARCRRAVSMRGPRAARGGAAARRGAPCRRRAAAARACPRTGRGSAVWTWVSPAAGAAACGGRAPAGASARVGERAAHRRGAAPHARALLSGARRPAPGSPHLLLALLAREALPLARLRAGGRAVLSLARPLAGGGRDGQHRGASASGPRLHVRSSQVFVGRCVGVGAAVVCARGGAAPRPWGRGAPRAAPPEPPPLRAPAAARAAPGGPCGAERCAGAPSAAVHHGTGPHTAVGERKGRPWGPGADPHAPAPPGPARLHLQRRAPRLPVLGLVLRRACLC
jgi:hypothetical protein